MNRTVGGTLMALKGRQQEQPAATPRPRARRALSAMEPQDDDRSVNVGLLCLEFVAVGRRLAAADVDAGTELTQWFTRFGLPSPLGGVTREDAARAQQLGRAINETARALMTNTPPDAQDIRDINEFAKHPTPVFLLRSDGQQRVPRGENGTAAVFSVVARDAINTFATAELRRLRACAGCDLLFYDRSPSGQRRWCSMKRCGERAASALYRERQASRTKTVRKVSP